jgi:hypothetical protein
VTEVFSSEAGGSPLLQPFLLIKFTMKKKKKKKKNKKNYKRI